MDEGGRGSVMNIHKNGHYDRSLDRRGGGGGVDRNEGREGLGREYL